MGRSSGKTAADSAVGLAAASDPAAEQLAAATGPAAEPERLANAAAVNGRYAESKSVPEYGRFSADGALPVVGEVGELDSGLLLVVDVSACRASVFHAPVS